MFNNPEFKQFVWQKIQSEQKQKLCSKLRNLSKNNNSYFEAVLNSADVKYEKLKGLANSKFAKQIQKLKLSVPNELVEVDDLCFISTKYFEILQSVNLQFVNSNMNNNPPKRYKIMTISENLVIRGLAIQKNDQFRGLTIQGKYDVNIQNSKFSRILIHAYRSANVEISGVKYLNAPEYGFYGENCTSIIMKNVQFNNCRRAFYINRSQNVFVSNINVKQCSNIAFFFDQLQNFEIKNSQIYKCIWGLYFCDSNGKIIDVVIRECKECGVILKNSQVRYDEFLCVNNAGNDVNMEDDNSTFVQGV